MAGPGLSRQVLAAAAAALGLGALLAGGLELDLAARALRGALGAAAVAVAATGLGAALLGEAGLLEAFALGGAALGLGLLLPAALGWSHPLVFTAALVLAAAGWRGLPGRAAPRILLPRAPGGVWIAGLALLTPGLIEALSPPVDTDEVYYQLALPAIWLREGALPGGPWLPDGSRPLPVQLLNAAALALGGEPGPKLLHWIGAGALALGLRDVGARRLGGRAGDVAALLLLGSYTAARAAGLANNDLPAALLVLLALDACLGERPWRMATLAGAALAAKYTAAGPVLGIFLLWWWRHPRAIPALAAMSAAALAWVLPWWLRNLAAGLHPLFPYAGWPGLEGFVFMYPEKYGLGREPLDLLLLPWRLITAADPRGYAFLGRVNPAALACAPAAIWGLIRGRAPVVGAAAVAFVAWALGVQALRLLLPAAPLLALAAAAGWRELAGWGRAAVALTWVLGLPANLGPWLADVADRAPAALGFEARDALLARRVRDWEAVQWINRYTPEGARVALLFSWPRYYLQRPLVLGSVEDHVPTRSLVAGGDPIAALRAQGVDYVVFHSRPFVRKTYPFLDDRAWQEQLQGPVDALSGALLAEGVLVFERGPLGVWRLPEPE